MNDVIQNRKFPKNPDMFGNFLHAWDHFGAAKLCAIDSSRGVHIIFGIGHPERLSIRGVTTS